MPQGSLTFRVGTRPLRIRVATASPPGVVTGLSVTTISASQLNVSWGASAGATGYVLRRSPDGSSWSQIATPSMTSYSDTGLTAGTTYDYQVEAVGPAGQSGWSVTASGMTQSSGGAGVPAAPTGLSATAGSDAIGPHVALSWNWSQGSGGAATAFKVEASDSVATSGQGDGSGFRWRPAMAVPATQTSCKIYSTDAYPIGGRTLTWAFRVTAVNPSGFAGTTQATAYSNTATLTILVPSRPAPGAPTRVQVTAGAAIAAGLYGAGTAAGTPVNISVLPADSATLHVEWNQADDNEVQFDLQYVSAVGYNGGAGPWTTVTAVTSSLVTRYFITGLAASTGYYVQVRATNEAGSSAWVDLATGPTGTTPTAVSTLGSGQVYSLTGANPPGLWTAQKDWRLRQAQADYNVSPTLNDAAQQFARLVINASNYALGYPHQNAGDSGYSNTLMFQCTGVTNWAQNVWNFELAPGVVSQGPIGNSGGVGWDAAITSASSSAPGSVWGTTLASHTTTASDTRIKSGRVLFLTGSLAGQHVQVTAYDGAGNITIGTPSVALTGLPSSGDTFQMIPYPFFGGADNYHQNAGFQLDVIMILWPWFTTTQQRQVTNMLAWWADSHTWVDQTGTDNSWSNTMGSHDDNMVGVISTLVIDHCIPSNPLQGRWTSSVNWGTPGTGVAPFCVSGSLDPSGRTSSTFGYADKSTFVNCIARYALIGRGGRYIVGDQYDSGDMREAVCSLEIMQTVLGTDHFPEWRRLWADWIRAFIYAMTPDKQMILILGDWQNTNALPSATYPTDRSLTIPNLISRPKQVAGAVRGHPNAPYLYQFMEEWQASNPNGYGNDFPESYIHQDWYPVRTNWRSTFPYGYFCKGNGTLYFQNGWGTDDAAYCVNFFVERAVDHGHFFSSNVHLYRNGTFAYSEPVGYGGAMIDGNPQTNSPMHCGLGPMWVAGVEASDVSSNGYAYAAWSTHGNYYPPNSPSTNSTTSKPVSSNAPPANLNEYTDTFVLEGSRSAFVLPGTDGHSETILFCDRMWDRNPRNLPNWGSAKSYGIQHYVANSVSVGGVPTGSVKAPPTAGTITPTTTQFSSNYTATSLVGYRVNMMTGATAGEFAYLVYNAVSAVPTGGSSGSGYQVGDVLTLFGDLSNNTYGWTMVQDGSALPSGFQANPATFTVTAVSGGAVTAVTVTNPGVYLLLPGTPTNVTGGSGTGCTLTVSYTPPWSGSPAYAVNLYPPLSQAPAAGDQFTIDYHLDNYSLVQYAQALQSLSFHAPTSPTVSGSSVSWTVPQDTSQGCLVNVVYPPTPTIVVHDESDLALLATCCGATPADGGSPLSASEIHYQIEVQPNSTAFPAGTTPVFNVLVTAVHAYDLGVTTISDTSVSSASGEAQGVQVSRTGLPDVLVMFGAREGYRVHQSGYSVTYTATTATSTVYLCDLDPSRTNSYTLDGGASTPLVPTAAGVGVIAVSGASSHTIILSVA